MLAVAHVAATWNCPVGATGSERSLGSGVETLLTATFVKSGTHTPPRIVAGHSTIDQAVMAAEPHLSAPDLTNVALP